MKNENPNTTETPEENHESNTFPIPKGNRKPNIIPVPQWNKYYPWPPPGGMRHLIFHAETNGFAHAFFRVGRSVLVDADCFWSIAKKQGGAK